ncbi:hypothetical protein P872_11455 [Rhodonellum psychrophilum GCM71 = DSM 17998]|uniref:Uncharacterized protein n=1 Tax=Rhodonellum psychrophilum GCM71 = DSM 17998 TaxID=1123057 RepID=U5BWM6_9BACT|nr:hypothetical protein P872_11455 [Rhodonellum psychrophilum GCM71 = DSM 17998]
MKRMMDELKIEKIKKSFKGPSKLFFTKTKSF